MTVVRWAGESSYMDYELELGLVIGSAGSDLQPESAPDYLFGVTVLNDFTARDVQSREMPSGFGPAKGKDFATALGPWVTTLDELDLDDLTMLAQGQRRGVVARVDVHAHVEHRRAARVRVAQRSAGAR